MDGMIIDLYGGFPGSRHDAHIFTSSLLNRRLAAVRLNRHTQYKSYMDKGYYNDTHAIAAHRVNANTPPWQIQSNNIMTPQRIAVEWSIGKLKVMSPLLNNLYVMKVQQSQVSKYVFACALLCNIHTCLYGNECSTHFNCHPPTIEQYLM